MARWYIVHVYSGFESKVATSIREQAELKGLQDDIEEIMVPTEEVVQIRRGQKINAERKFFPGYVMICTEMDQDVWYLIKDTPKVTGFPGGASGLPAPLTEEEVKGILDQVRGEAAKPKPKVNFDRGENVRVIDGPFINFSGTVDEINPDKGKLKVMVSIFGRATPVELEFPQVEKI